MPVAPPHEELCIADLTFRLHAAREIGPVRGVPVQHHNARERVQFLGRLVAHYGDERRVHGLEAPVPAALVNPFRDAFEQPPELRLAAAERLLREPPLDGDAGKLGCVAHDFRLFRSRQARLTTIDAERPEHLADGCLDRSGPGRAQSGIDRGLPPLRPEWVFRNVCNEYLAAEIHGSGARAVAYVDRRMLENRAQPTRQMGRDRIRERMAVFGEHAHGADCTHTDRFDETRDGGQHFR